MSFKRFTREKVIVTDTNPPGTIVETVQTGLWNIPWNIPWMPHPHNVERVAGLGDLIKSPLITQKMLNFYLEA